MKNLILTSILFLISLISFSQTNFSFINENVIYFESGDNLSVDELMLSKETKFSTENESYGVYNIDLINKEISLY
jgi:Skp family chaperone for outer membrane proteins